MGWSACVLGLLRWFSISKKEEEKKKRTPFRFHKLGGKGTRIAIHRRRGSRGAGGPSPPPPPPKKKGGERERKEKKKKRGKRKRDIKKLRCHNLFFCAYRPIGLHWPIMGGGAGGSRPNKRRGNIVLCIKSYKLSFSVVKFNKEKHRPTL